MKVSKVIQVIAWFDEKGKIRPVKFRYEDEGELRVVVIDEILNREFKKLGGNPTWTFTCTSTINDVKSIYDIKYDPLSNIWVLFFKN